MDNFKLEAYRRMYLIRCVEEVIVERYHRDQRMRTPVHLSIGQEAAAVGVTMALPENAHVFSTHRCHSYYLAKGGNLDAMIAELYGKATGCCGGRGGSMHLADDGFMAHPIVGDSVSLAVGSALAAKLDGSDRITAVFLGDAVPETGQFWEALNFSALHKLPLLFICENNGYATQTPLRQRQPTHNAIADRVQAFTSALRISDQDVEAVYGIARSCLKILPSFLEIETYRRKEHCGPNDDWDLGYRRMDERPPDPLLNAQAALPESDIAAIQASVQEAVLEAFERAEAAPWPELGP